MKTVLITGCSSGYGLATAHHFHAQGWKVVAAMRTPRDIGIPPSSRFQAVALDVTRPDSIVSALEEIDTLDVLVNNAGIGLFGAFEATPMTTVREVFETNTFGTMAMCQAVIPRLREQRSGTIVNVTSSATLAPFPLVAAYTASKAAVEGFSASLALELRDFDVRVRLIEPGYGPGTNFSANSGERMQGLITEPYAAYAQRVFAEFVGASLTTTPEDVAQAVWLAANDSTERLHRAAGPDAVALAEHHGR